MTKKSDVVARWMPGRYSNGRRCPQCNEKLTPGDGCQACWYCKKCGIGGCDNYSAVTLPGSVVYKDES